MTNPLEKPTTDPRSPEAERNDQPHPTNHAALGGISSSGETATADGQKAPMENWKAKIPTVKPSAVGGTEGENKPTHGNQRTKRR